MSYFDSDRETRVREKYKSKSQGLYHYMGTRRSRVDWDAEVQKTNRIARRSLILSGLCFAITFAVMIGVNRMGIEVDIPRRVLSVVCIILACLVLRITLKHRSRILRERDERHRDSVTHDCTRDAAHDANDNVDDAEASADDCDRDRGHDCCHDHDCDNETARM